MSVTAQKTKTGARKVDVEVTAIVPLNELVTRFEFRRMDGELFPPFSGGAHTVVEMQDGDIKRLNPYSLVSDPAEREMFAISVLGSRTVFSLLLRTGHSKVEWDFFLF